MSRQSYLERITLLISGMIILLFFFSVVNTLIQQSLTKGMLMLTFGCLVLLKYLNNYFYQRHLRPETTFWEVTNSMLNGDWKDIMPILIKNDKNDITNTSIWVNMTGIFVIFSFIAWIGCLFTV